MAILGDAVKGIRMAGSALGQYLNTPETYKQLGKKIALETAVGTAVQQGLPRVLGAPAPDLKSSLLHNTLSSALNHPVAGALQAVGVPSWAANATGTLTGTLGGAAATQAVSRPIVDPEIHQEPHPQLAQYMQLQRMEAEMEQQRYNNQIQLAYARNYSPPTTIVHKNPSAEFETSYRMVNPNVRYA